MSYDDFPTPREVQREAIRWVPAALIVCLSVMLVGGVVTFIGWQASWWFTTQNTQRQAHNVQANYNVQEGYISRINQDIGAIDANIAIAGSAGTGGTLQQDIHSGNDACMYANLLVPGDITVTTSMQRWIDANCSAGALVPTSNVYKGGNGE